MQPEDFGEGKLINIHEEGGCDEKDEGVPEKVTLAKKNFALKELSGIFHNIEIRKDKMLETDSNLENSRTTHQGTEKTLALHCKLHDKRKETSAVPTALGTFFTKK